MSYNWYGSFTCSADCIVKQTEKAVCLKVLVGKYKDYTIWFPKTFIRRRDSSNICVHINQIAVYHFRNKNIDIAIDGVYVDMIFKGSTDQIDSIIHKKYI